MILTCRSICADRKASIVIAYISATATEYIGVGSNAITLTHTLILYIMLKLLFTTTFILISFYSANGQELEPFQINEGTAFS